jgi:hypothetical protein
MKLCCLSSSASTKQGTVSLFIIARQLAKDCCTQTVPGSIGQSYEFHWSFLVCMVANHGSGVAVQCLFTHHVMLLPMHASAAGGTQLMPVTNTTMCMFMRMIQITEYPLPFLRAAGHPLGASH